MTNEKFLGNIALAFSGGGFRAASFSLGVLDYLGSIEHPADNRPLLHHVTFLSSASGGTIATALYSLHQARGTGFPAFYRQLHERLSGTGLLNNVMDILNQKKYWDDCPHKSRNLINAFSLAYKADLFGPATIGDISASDAPPSGLHLDEVCFNSTDFYNGLLFRQNTKMKPDKGKDEKFRYGNSRYYVLPQTAAHIRLADVLAASSCFPGGFEPITFPTDFTYTVQAHTLTSVELLQGTRIELQELDWTELKCLYGASVETSPPPFDPNSLASVEEAFAKLPLEKGLKIGLMDGGITDNQGVESMIDAQKRRQSGDTDFQPFDLMLVNDVGSHFMDPYKVQIPKEKYSGLSGISIRGLAFLCVGVSLLAIAGCIWIGQSKYSQAWQIIPALFLFACLPLLVGILFLRRFISRKTRKGAGLDLDRNFSPEVTHKLLHHFGRTPLGVLKVMLQARFNSIITLNNDVFLKRIRYLLYKQLDETFERFLVKANHVYDLAYSNDRERSKDCFKASLSTDLQNVAQSAFEMGTTLWFDAEADKMKAMPALVAAGHFTTCYNLLEYIARMKNDSKGPAYYNTLSTQERSIIDRLEEKLLVDFRLFNDDPFWLYNRHGKEWLEAFTPVTARGLEFADFKGLRANDRMLDQRL